MSDVGNTLIGDYAGECFRSLLEPVLSEAEKKRDSEGLPPHIDSLVRQVRNQVNDSSMFNSDDLHLEKSNALEWMDLIRQWNSDAAWRIVSTTKMATPPISSALIDDLPF